MGLERSVAATNGATGFYANGHVLNAHANLPSGTETASLALMRPFKTATLRFPITAFNEPNHTQPA